MDKKKKVNKKKKTPKDKYSQDIVIALNSDNPIKGLEPFVLDFAGDDKMLRASLSRIWNRRGLSTLDTEDQ